MGKENKPKITLKNIKAYIQGNTRMLAKELGEITRFPLLAKHIQEQVAYRKHLCPDCYINKECKFCGCSVPGKLYSDKSCGGGRWEDMIYEPEKWEEFKNKNNIQIDITDDV